MTALTPPPTAVRARTTRRASTVEGLSSSAFLLPVLAVFVVLFAVPLAQTFYFSLTNFSGYSTDVEFVGLRNYQQVFSDPSLLQGLTFTLLFAIATTAVITCLAIPLAVVLNKRFLGRDLVRSVFFFLSVPSLAILGLVWQYILSPLESGVVNTVLHTLFGA